MKMTFCLFCCYWGAQCMGQGCTKRHKQKERVHSNEAAQGEFLYFGGKCEFINDATLANLSTTKQSTL